MVFLETFFPVLLSEILSVVITLLSLEHRIGDFLFSMTSKGCTGRLFGLAALGCHMAQICIGQYLQMHTAMLRD